MSISVAAFEVAAGLALPPRLCRDVRAALQIEHALPALPSAGDVFEPWQISAALARLCYPNLSHPGGLIRTEVAVMDEAGDVHSRAEILDWVGDTLAQTVHRMIFDQPLDRPPKTWELEVYERGESIWAQLSVTLGQAADPARAFATFGHPGGEPGCRGRFMGEEFRNVGRLLDQLTRRPPVHPEIAGAQAYVAQREAAARAILTPAVGDVVHAPPVESVSTPTTPTVH